MKKLEGVCVINLAPKDIVRHKLVTQIVNAYDAFDKQWETEQGVQKQRIANTDSSTSDNDDGYTIFENTDNDFN